MAVSAFALRRPLCQVYCPVLTSHERSQIANTVFNNKLASALPVYAPDAPFELVRRSVEAIKTLPLDQQPGVITSYVMALNQVFLVSERAFRGVTVFI